MGRICMWAVLIFIGVASCNAELHPKKTVGLPSVESRIVGGTDTTIEKYPFAVQIFQQPKTLHCGGSLLSTKHVLTAAVCFYKRYGNKYIQSSWTDYFIRASTTMLNSGGTLHSIVAVKIHELFSYTPRENNVALVLLSTPIDLITNVARPVSIADEDTVVADNSSVTVVGWGRTNRYEENAETTFLNEVTMPKMNLDICKARYMNKSIAFPSNTICTGILDLKEDKGPCTGDLGAALLYEGLIVGIASVTYGACHNSEYPWIYLNVTSYTKWINDKIENFPICSELQDGNYARTSLRSTGSPSSKVGAITLLSSIFYLIL